MKKELIKLANHLDRIGRVKEANYIDNLLKKADQNSKINYDDKKIFFESDYNDLMKKFHNYKGDDALGLNYGNAVDIIIEAMDFKKRYSDLLNMEQYGGVTEEIDEGIEKLRKMNEKKTPAQVKMENNINKYKNKKGVKIVEYGKPREELGGNRVSYAIYDASETQLGTMTSGMRLIQIVDLRNGFKLYNEKYGGVKPGYHNIYDNLIKFY